MSTTDDRVITRAQSDEQLVTLARAGDERAVVQLVSRYEHVAAALSAPYFFAGGDREDVLQEARVGVFKAIRDFDHRLGIPFGAFANLCIRRHVIASVKTASRKKHNALTFALRGAQHDDGDGEAFELVDLAEAPNADPVELLTERDRARVVLDVIANGLSRLERDVVTLFLQGRTHDEIQQELGLPYTVAWGSQQASRRGRPRAKQVENAIERVRLKIRAALAEDDRLPLGAAA